MGVWGQMSENSRDLLREAQAGDAEAIRQRLQNHRSEDDVMKHSIDELIGVAHRYYPRGVSSDDPRYKETEEYHRLVAARRQAGADNEPWRAVLRRLGDHFPKSGVQDGSLHLPTGGLGASYSGDIYLPNAPGEHYHTVGFQVSFLAPYYIVYSSRVVDDLEKTEALRASQDPYACVFVDDTCHILPASVVKPEFRAKEERLPVRRRDLSLDPSPDEQPYAAWIARDIEATWGYERMPPEVGKVVVPDVATNLRNLGEATLYDCLLSDYW